MHAKFDYYFKNCYYDILGYPPSAYVGQTQLSYGVPMTAQSYPSGAHVAQNIIATTIKQGSNIANYTPIQTYTDQVIWFISFHAQLELFRKKNWVL